MKSKWLGFILVLCSFAFTGCPGDLLLSPPASLASDVLGPVPGEMGPVASPTFTPAGGPASSYRGSQTVTIQQSDPEDIRKIYYTIDGSTPTAQSPEYTGPITFEGNDKTFTIKAVAIATDNRWTDSTVAETSIVIAPYRIYVGTTTGLHASVDNGTTWNVIMGGSILCIAASGDKVYAGTSSGLYVYDFNTTSTTHYSTSNGLPHNQVYGVTVHENTIYVSTLGGGLGISSDGGNNWTTLNTTNHLPSNYVLCAYPSGNLLYVGTSGGVAVFENDVFKETLVPGSGSGESIVSHILLSGSRLFVGTFGGPFEYNGSAWSLFLSGSTVAGLHGDDDILLTVSISGDSVSTDGGSSWSTLPSKGSGSVNSTGGCFVAGKYFYIGTLGGLAVSNNYGDGGSWTRHLDSYKITAVYAAP